MHLFIYIYTYIIYSFVIVIHHEAWKRWKPSNYLLKDFRSRKLDSEYMPVLWVLTTNSHSFVENTTYSRNNLYVCLPTKKSSCRTPRANKNQWFAMICIAFERLLSISFEKKAWFK